MHNIVKECQTLYWTEVFNQTGSRNRKPPILQLFLMHLRSRSKTAEAEL